MWKIWEWRKKIEKAAHIETNVIKLIMKTSRLNVISRSRRLHILEGVIFILYYNQHWLSKEMDICLPPHWNRSPFPRLFSDYERLINFFEAIPLAICQIFGYLFPFLVIVHIEIFRLTMFSIFTVAKVMFMLLLLFLLLLLVAIATVLIVRQNLK